jgi:PAS domain-containing protein
MIDLFASSPHLHDLLFRGFEAKLAEVCRTGADAVRHLDRLQVPLYVTDADGAVLAWNTAAASFSGREPTTDDRWCVTHKLRTVDGAPLAHADCPMAIALRAGAPVRGAIAVAERPDGSAAPFTPFPTPIKDADGRLVGAFNLLLDVSDPIRATHALLQAAEDLAAPDVDWEH